MPKKVFLLLLLVFWALQATTQTDNLNKLAPTDTTALDHTRAVPVSEAQKTKSWLVVTVITTILASSYLLYNVRSR